MKQVYKCDFCDEVFPNKTEAEEHEKRCGYNPENKINDKLVFRLSMIFESMLQILACALNEIAEDELDWLYCEVDRATQTNCPFTISRHKNKMLCVLREAKIVKNKHEGRNSSTYNDVNKEYPEIYKAVVETLKRKAWNER